MSQAAVLELEGMPEPSVLRRVESEGQTVVWFGRRALFCYDCEDLGMRNLAVVAVTDAGVACKEAARVFGLSAQYVSMLRGRARAAGSAGVVRRRGRPPKLSERQVTQARAWAGQGVTQTEVAARLGVARSVISGLLARLGPVPAQAELVPADPADDAADPVAEGAAADPVVDETTGEVAAVAAEATAEAAGQVDADAVRACVGPAPGALARIGQGEHVSRYAGAMLLHAFLDRVDAGGVFAALAGAPSRRYDDTGLLTATTMGFALGASCLEGTKHLVAAQAGPLAGLAALPELRTLRPRLAALADSSDPLALQRKLAAAMLSADQAELPVYFVDDHFVPYAGAKPVGKGYNTKRGRAQPGRADTLVTDYRGRAVVFTSGEPSGLTKTLPPVLEQLGAVTGPDAKVMLAFDRGGAYAAVFTTCRDAGADWLTYRRGKLAEPTATPARSATLRDGKRVYVMLADETVPINGYGTARQLTLYEHDQPVLQVLTSDTTATGAALLTWLRARWRIENAFKYLSAHHGIDWLCDYTADIVPNTAKVPNPARTAARTQVKDAGTQLADAERALAQLISQPDLTTTKKNQAIPAAQTRITTAQNQFGEATAALKDIPAKLPANQLNPGAAKALPRTRRRNLQMVLRLLAYNAETWLADHLGAYLHDPDEYRAITRNLLHLGGTISYTSTAITVALDRPGTPRLTRALRLLLDELNTTPPRLPGDRRPIAYTITNP